ncbi:MAG: TonB-dependent receptor [Blastocatellia bacterium]|nr:TonB-dependent receptor [Blastocatellia bacterium]
MPELCRLLKKQPHVCLCSTVFWLLLSFFCGISGAEPGWSQTTSGTLIGTVIDPDGKPLADSIVTVVNVDNGTTRATRTKVDGSYRMPFLEPGRYIVKAERGGYQPNQSEEVRIPLNVVTPLTVPPIRLFPVGVTPTANTPPTEASSVNPTDATIRGNIDSQTLLALPIGGIRTFDAMAFLFPGVTPPPATYGASGPGLGPGVGTSGQFSVNGQRGRANNFTVDGSDNNDQDVGVRRQGFVALVSQSIESINEFQISTLLADAEAGRNFGGQVNVVSRSGGNGIHGSIHNFFTTDGLQARNFFDLTGGPAGDKDKNRRNQFGITVGAPLVKDRTHVFFSFERQDLQRNQENHFSVPRAAERISTLFSTQLARDLFDLFPLPNHPGGPYGANTFTRILPADAHGTLFSGRLSHQMRLLGKDHAFTGRYNLTDDETIIPAVGGGLNASINSRTRTQNISLYLDTTLTASSFNQVRVSYGRTTLGFDEQPGSPYVFQSRPIRDVNGDGVADGLTGPLGQLTVSPFSPIGVDVYTFPQGRTNNTFQYADTFVTTIGKHAIKFGADIRRLQFNSFLDRNYRAQATFTPGFVVSVGTSRIGTGAEFVNFGVPSNIFQSFAVTPDSTLGLRQAELDFFFTDSWRIHPRLTLSYGVRYEYNTVPKEVNGRIERTFGLKIGDLPPGDPSLSSFSKIFEDSLNAYTNYVSGRKSIFDRDGNNFAPRVGVAWSPFAKRQFVIRGGYGLAYDPLLGSLTSQSRNVFPAFIPVNFGASTILLGGVTSGRFINPAFLFVGSSQTPVVRPGTVNTIGLPSNLFVPGIGSLFSLQAANPGLAFTLPVKDLRTPYTHQFGAQVESTIGKNYVVSVGYVGSRSRSLIRFRSPNLGPNSIYQALVIPGQAPVVVAPKIKRAIPQLGAFTTFDNSAAGEYDSLQVRMDRQYSRGFKLGMAYTFSRADDDVSDLFDLTGAFAFVQDEQNPAADRGPANFDVRHRFVTHFVYDLPLWQKHKLLGGWQVAGIVTLQTGQPYTVNTQLDVNLDGLLTDRLNTTQGLVFSDSGRTRIALAPGTTIDSLRAPFNVDSPTSGAVGRNSFRAAGIANLDVVVTKNFSFGERQKLIFRAECYNLFNRTHFGVPVRILESPAFGQAVNTALPARLVQLAVKYQF